MSEAASGPIFTELFNLLIIDPQIDFCEGGGLAVTGATKDIERIVTLIEKNKDKINNIFVSLDTHTYGHIGHYLLRIKGTLAEPKFAPRMTTFSVDKNNNIVSNDEKGKPTEIEYEANVIEEHQAAMDKYLKLYITYVTEKEYPAINWFKHCIQGTDKWKIHSSLQKILDRMPNKVEYHIKGQNQLTEMYSIMKAEAIYEDLIQDKSIIDDDRVIINQYLYSPNIPETFLQKNNDPSNYVVQPNNTIDPQKLSTYNRFRKSDLNTVTETSRNVYNLKTSFNDVLFEKLTDNGLPIVVCGEASSHCVKNSTKDIVDKIKTPDSGKPPKTNNVYIVSNASSPVTNYEKDANEFIKYMEETDICGVLEVIVSEDASKGKLKIINTPQKPIKVKEIGYQQETTSFANKKRNKFLHTKLNIKTGGRKTRKNRKHKTRRPKMVKHSSRKHKKRTHRRNAL